MICCFFVASFLERKIPWAPSVSLHPRSSVRVEREKAVRLVVAAIEECIVLVKNQVFEKKLFLVVFVFRNRMVVEAIVAPTIVTIMGVFFMVDSGNKVGRLNIHRDIVQPTKMDPIASRTRGKKSFWFSSFIGFIEAFLGFFEKQNVTIRNL